MDTHLIALGLETAMESSKNCLIAYIAYRLNECPFLYLSFNARSNDLRELNRDRCLMIIISAACAILLEIGTPLALPSVLICACFMLARLGTSAAASESAESCLLVHHNFWFQLHLLTI